MATARVMVGPSVCLQGRSDPIGPSGCRAVGDTRGPCTRCDGTGKAPGAARCWQCRGTGTVRLCRHHAFEALRAIRRRNRRRGLCGCGAERTPGFKSCQRCRGSDTARQYRRRAKVRPLADRELRALAQSARADSPAGRELRRRLRALPPELRRYGPLGLTLPSDADMREPTRAAGRARTAPAQPMPGFDALSGRLQAFVRDLVTNGGNGTAAARAAGYGAVSTARGGRAAAVAGCRIAKRPYIVAAVRKYRARLDHQAALARELARRDKARADRASIETMLAMFAGAGPQSRAARVLRRMRHEPVSREPSRCRCGAPVSDGFASCELCRARERRRGQYRRAVFGRRINAWRREHRRRLRCTESAQKRAVS